MHPLWCTGAHTGLCYPLTLHISREGISVNYPSIELVQALGWNRLAGLSVRSLVCIAQRIYSIPCLTTVALLPVWHGDFRGSSGRRR